MSSKIITGIIRTIEGNKKSLLTEAGFKSVQQAARELGLSSSEVYETLFNLHNEQVREITRKIKKVKQEKKTKKEEKSEKILREIDKIESEAKKSKEKKKKSKEKRIIKELKEKEKEHEANIQEFLSQITAEGGAIDISEMLDLFGGDVNLAMSTVFRHIFETCGKTLMDINGIKYALNDETIKRFDLKDLLINISQVVNGFGSDAEVLIQIEEGEGTIDFEPLKETHKNEKVSGAFFKYMHNTPLDLAKYGVYAQDEKADYTDTCLIFALKKLGLEGEKLDTLCELVKTRIVPISNLEMLCIASGIQINLKKENDKKHVKKYGDDIFDVYEIGNIDGHYFVNEKTDITRYALENMILLISEGVYDWKTIYKKKGNSYCRDKTRTISSFELIELLLENKEKYLIPFTFENSDIAATQFYEQTEQEITILPEVTERTCRLLPEEGIISQKKTFTAVFDFETFANMKNKHIPYLGCVRELDGKEKNSFIGENSGKKLLDWCAKQARNQSTDRIRLIAHNAGYDLNFIMKELNVVTGLIQKGTHLISCDAIYWYYEHKMFIEIRDSYNLISSPLRDFGKMFKLEQGKEVMQYDLYNIELNKTENEKLSQVFVSVEEAMTYLSGEKEKKLFVENLKKWELLNSEDKYDIIEYSRRYCEIDCEVLANGYKVFKGWMQEAVGKNIDNHLTIASLGHSYMKSQGCYDGVYELSGVPQRFIQGTVVGGRTMCCKNEKQFFKCDNAVKRKVMQDFDGVSLYPSAMNRMDGFLKGTPKVIRNLDWEWVRKQDGYFIDVEVTKIEKERDFPILSIKNEKGIRVFTNDVVGKVFRVDKITLEDAIEFQGIEFEIIRGYYFSEGFNTKVKETILHLFNERLKKKKEKNSIEVVYKLVMNASYGKSIMKEIKEDVKIFNSKEKYDKFVSRNYNWIKSIVQLDGCNKYRVTSVKAVNKHFNIAQVGSSVLSWSKRIMSEVMCLAEDLGTKIFYQDTDSMHLEEEYIPVLASEFKNKYGRELIGKALGQFHSDFSMDYENENWEKKSFEDVHAVDSIFLGKKSYIDRLKGTNSKTGEIEESYHIRMKGIPSSCIWYTTEKLGYDNPFQMYEDLAKGVSVEFDLTQHGTKANFKQGKDFSIKTLSIFKRNLKF